MIRPAGLGDIEAIQLIARITWAQAYESLIPSEVQEKFLEYAYNTERLEKLVVESDLIVATEDDLIVGFANFTVEEEICYIQSIYVLPGHQRQGFGGALMKYIIEKVKIKAKKLVVEVEVGNNMAESFYEEQGFEKTIYSYDEIYEHPLKTAHYERKL